MQPEWVTTSTLLLRLRDFENDSAWSGFAERFRRPVVRFARDRGLPPDEADDAAQEILLAFAKAYREKRYDPAAGRLSHWLFGIAHRQVNRARTRLARERMRAGAPQPSGALEEIPEREASVIWEREWKRHALKRCFEQVRAETSETTFRAFELVVQEARPPAEAARELGVPVKTVYNAKHRVLQRMRELREQFESLD